MYLPKTDIYNALKELGYEVSQTQPTVFNNLPFIGFSILQNVPTYFLNEEIAYQDIDVQIDIWANTSVEASEIISQLETKMMTLGYHLIYNSDVPNVGNVFHVVTRFTTKN